MDPKALSTYAREGDDLNSAARNFLTILLSLQRDVSVIAGRRCDDWLPPSPPKLGLSLRQLSVAGMENESDLMWALLFHVGFYLCSIRVTPSVQK